MDNRLTFWLALGEGIHFTWADWRGHYQPQFYWSGELRGQRVVECCYQPQKLLG